MKKSLLRGGIYHVALICISAAAFNWGFFSLTGVDLAGRISAGVAVPQTVIALVLCVSSVIVLWNNWVD